MLDLWDSIISSRSKLQQQILATKKPNQKTVNSILNKEKGDIMSNDDRNKIDLEKAMAEYNAEVEDEKTSHPVSSSEDLDDLDDMSVSDDSDDSDIDEPEQQEVESNVLPRLSDLAGPGVVRVSVRPKVLFTISYTNNELRDIASSISTVHIDSGYYSLASALRNGDGSKKKAYGALRQPLVEFLSYIESLCGNSDTVLVGAASSAEDSLDAMSRHIMVEANRILYGKFVDAEGNPSVSVRLPSTSKGRVLDIDDAEAEYTTIDIRNIYDMSCWDSAVQLDDGSFELSIVFHLNMQVPLLYLKDEKERVLVSMHKVLAGMSSTVECAECYFAFAIDAAGLVDPEVRLLLESVLSDEQFNPVDDSFVVVSDDYLEQSISSGCDPMGILPVGMTRAEIKDMVFVHGGSLLALGTVPLNVDTDA